MKILISDTWVLCICWHEYIGIGIHVFVHATGAPCSYRSVTLTYEASPLFDEIWMDALCIKDALGAQFFPRSTCPWGSPLFYGFVCSSIMPRPSMCKCITIKSTSITNKDIKIKDAMLLLISNNLWKQGNYHAIWTWQMEREEYRCTSPEKKELSFLATKDCTRSEHWQCFVSYLAVVQIH